MIYKKVKRKTFGYKINCFRFVTSKGNNIKTSYLAGEYLKPIVTEENNVQQYKHYYYF